MPTGWSGSSVISPARDRIILSVHPHNDRGTAVATAELGLMAGAERVEGTLFGNGERDRQRRSLITPLALNLLTQGVEPPARSLSHRRKHARSSSSATTFRYTHDTPTRGELVYTAFSGSHQDAIKKGMDAQQRSQSDRWDVPYPARRTQPTSGEATKRSSASTRNQARAASRI